MTEKIKAKKGWYVGWEPRAPYEPRRPEEFYETEEFTELSVHDVANDPCGHKCTRLSDIRLPEGVKSEDVVIKYFDADGDNGYKFGTVVTKRHRHPNYKQDLARYEKDIKAYEVAVERHKEDVKLWKLWVKQDRAAYVERQIKNAEAVLRKHGRLK